MGWNDCPDCKKDISGTIDYFMVKGKIWKQYGNGNGMLCFRCLEKRMERKLLLSDLTDSSVNEDFLISLILNKNRWGMQ